MTISAPVLRLRRYPVKSMAGEDMTSVDLDHRGIVGDRWFAVRDEEGHFASGKDSRRFRRRDEEFEHSAMTDGTIVRVSHQGGSSWDVADPALDAPVSARTEAPVSVRLEEAVPHQDMGAVSLIGTATTAGARAAVGHRRRSATAARAGRIRRAAVPAPGQESVAGRSGLDDDDTEHDRA